MNKPQLNSGLKKKVIKKHFEDNCHNFNLHLVLGTTESFSIFLDVTSRRIKRIFSFLRVCSSIYR